MGQCREVQGETRGKDEDLPHQQENPFPPPTSAWAKLSSPSSCQCPPLVIIQQCYPGITARATVGNNLEATESSSQEDSCPGKEEGLNLRLVALGFFFSGYRSQSRYPGPVWELQDAIRDRGSSPLSLQSLLMCELGCAFDPCYHDSCCLYNLGTFSRQEEWWQAHGPLYQDEAYPVAYPELIWLQSVYKANPNCKGVGKEPFLPGALLLQTEVMFSGERRHRERMLDQLALCCHCCSCWATPVHLSSRWAGKHWSEKCPAGKGDHCMSQCPQSI